MSKQKFLRHKHATLYENLGLQYFVNELPCRSKGQANIDALSKTTHMRRRLNSVTHGKDLTLLQGQRNEFHGTMQKCTKYDLDKCMRVTRNTFSYVTTAETYAVHQCLERNFMGHLTNMATFLKYNVLSDHGTKRWVYQGLRWFFLVFTALSKYLCVLNFFPGTLLQNVIRYQTKMHIYITLVSST